MFLLPAMAQQATAPAIPQDKKIEQKVEALLKRMTLEEKIGQMTELVSDVIGKFDQNGNFQLDNAFWTQSSGNTR